MYIHVYVSIDINNACDIMTLPVAVASCVVSSSRALSGSILLANHKDLKDVSLESVRMLLLDDGANPCEYTYMYMHVYCMYTHVYCMYTCMCYTCTCV